MCKIFAMTNMENVKLTHKFVSVVKNAVTGTGDNDGFGYAVLGENGDLGGERSIRPSRFTPSSNGFVEKMIDKLPIVLRSSDSFGKIDNEHPRAFIGHGRLSTNEVSLQNTHPFTNDKVALIHNGVVSDMGAEEIELKTTCDTEILLRHWEKGGMKQIEENVSGYYAMAILDKGGQLHVVRDDRAMLWITYCRTVHSYMIATTQEILKSVAKKMKWQIEKAEEITENTYAVFEKNEIVTNTPISPKKSYSNTLSAKAERAFGINQGSWNETDASFDEYPGYREAMDKDRDDDFRQYGYRHPMSDASTSIEDETKQELVEENGDDSPAYQDEEVKDVVAVFEDYTSPRHYRN